MMARGPTQANQVSTSNDEDDAGIKENKIVMTELMSLLLK